MLSLLAVLTWGPLASSQGLAADSRLAAPIQVTEFAATAPQLCADISRLAGVPIDCNPQLKDDLVVLVVKSRPAREIMAKIASTFDWEWQPKGAGYRLEPSPHFQRDAAHGRERDLLRQVRALKKVASQQLAELPKVDEKNPEETQSRRVALIALRELPEDDLVRLADYRLVLSATPGPLELPMPDSVRSEADTLLDIKRSLVAKEGSTSPPRDSSPGFLTHLLVSFSAWGSIEIVYLDDLERATSYRIGLDLVKETPPKPESSLQPVTEDAFRAGSRREIDKTKEPLEAFGWCLMDMAQRLSVDVVSDAYDPYLRQDRWEKGKEVFTAQEKMPLRTEGGWLVNRAPNWPRLREEQVPRAAIHYFAKDDEQHTIDDSARMAPQLTLAQLDSPLFPLSQPKYGFYVLLNSLSAFSKPGRQTILVGDLPSAAIDYLCSSASPNNPLSEFFDVLHRSFFGEPEFTPLTLSAALAFVPRMPDAFPGFAHTYTRLVARQAQVSIQCETLPSVYDSDRKSICSPSDLSTPWDPYGEEIGFRPAHMKLASTRAVQIRIPIQDDLSLTFEDSEDVIGADLSPDELTWPPDLVRRLQAHSAANHAFRTRAITDANARGELPPTESGGPPPRT